jgi:hypothetical protein
VWRLEFSKLSCITPILFLLGDQGAKLPAEHQEAAREREQKTLCKFGEAIPAPTAFGHQDVWKVCPASWVL